MSTLSCIIRIFEVFHAAQHVRVDLERSVVLVWKGGHTINGYSCNTTSFVGFTSWCVGDFAKDNATLLEVAQSMQRAISRGDYPPWSAPSSC